MEAGKPLELYVHIPFCVKKCAYCDFLSFPVEENGQAETVQAGSRMQNGQGESVQAGPCAQDGQEKFVLAGSRMQDNPCRKNGRWGGIDMKEREAYIPALIREIHARGRACTGYTVQTIFVGGGTPSILSMEETASLFAALKNSFRIAADAEITMEANPGTVTAEKLKFLHSLGINRLSIGAQSMNNRELKALGRIHSAEDFACTWEAARRAGFANLNLDLMMALPGQTAESWEKTLRRAAAFSPEHISAYSLMIEEGTPFYELYGDASTPAATSAPAAEPASARAVLSAPAAVPEILPLPDEDTEREMYVRTQEILAEYGYRRYEISNYAKEGYACLHNIGYWRRTEYLGLGLGAASLMDECRFKNTDNMKKYLAAFADTPADEACRSIWEMPQTEEFEVLSKAEQMAEYMFLGLRMMSGISKREFGETFGRSLEEVYGAQIRKLCSQGLLTEDEDRIRLTERGCDICNLVCCEFVG